MHPSSGLVRPLRRRLQPLSVVRVALPPRSRLKVINVSFCFFCVYRSFSFESISSYVSFESRSYLNSVITPYWFAPRVLSLGLFLSFLFVGFFFSLSNAEFCLYCFRSCMGKKTCYDSATSPPSSPSDLSVSWSRLVGRENIRPYRSRIQPLSDFILIPSWKRTKFFILNFFRRKMVFFGVFQLFLLVIFWCFSIFWGCFLRNLATNLVMPTSAKNQ